MFLCRVHNTGQWSSAINNISSTVNPHLYGSDETKPRLNMGNGRIYDILKEEESRKYSMQSKILMNVNIWMTWIIRVAG